MDIRVQPKSVETLIDTPLLHQTRLWSRIKSRLGWKPEAFDIAADKNTVGDVLVLSKPISDNHTLAYVPYGPEALPDPDHRGQYLIALSEELRPYLDSQCLLLRWDLPWESPYTQEEDRYDASGHWIGPPDQRLRELRMNWGVDGTGLRKAPEDLLPPDTFLVDLTGTEEEILARMRPKTRYNIGLSQRKGVKVRIGGPQDLSIWNRLYRETARRNHIVPHGPEFFIPLLEAPVVQKEAVSRVILLIAQTEDIPLAAMFLSLSADRATYLYGASSDTLRSLMAPYALQWMAIRIARNSGCSSYDLFGAAPSPDPDHPMYGLYRFKCGFGGHIIHRQGVWDYPYDPKDYDGFIAHEAVAQGFNL